MSEILRNVHTNYTIQPMFVSLSTVIVTGLHVSGIFIAMIWFLLELKRETSLARSVKSLLSWIRHPRQQYLKNKLHLLRNVYW